jgi:hypothetical protein
MEDYRVERGDYRVESRDKRVEILAIYALYSIISTLLSAISNKNLTTPLYPKKLSVPLQAILGYKPSGLSKKK